MGMNSMVNMSSLKSKFGKNPIFGQDKLEDRHRDKLEDKIDFVRVYGIKIINLKGVLGQDELEDKIDFVHGQTNLNTKSV